MPSETSTTTTEDPVKYYYEQTASQINREESLINWRLTALLTINGFLFAATALSLTENFSLSCELRSFWFKLLSSFGVIVNVGGLLGIQAAYRAIDHLKSNLVSRLPDIGSGDPYPRPYGDTTAKRMGKVPSLLIPVALIVFWCVVMVKLW